MPKGFGARFLELYSVIELWLFQMDTTMDFDVLMEDPDYDHFAELLSRFDNGERSAELLNEMEEIYALAS